MSTLTVVCLKGPGKFQIMNFCNHGIDRARSYMNDAIGIFALGDLEAELSPLLYVLKFYPQNAPMALLRI